MDLGDLSEVGPGHVFSTAWCEEVTKLSQYHPGFRLACLELMNKIDMALRDMGRDLVFRFPQSNQIEVLSHADASRYCEARHEKCVRDMRRFVRKLNAVDLSQLDDEQKSAHREAMERNGRQVAALHASRTHRRPLPQLEPTV